MVSQQTRQAQQAVEACESQIVDAYDQLTSKAKDMAQDTLNSAQSSKMLKTFLPLSILGVIGLICLSGPWLIGIVCIVSGIIWAYVAHSGAAYAERSVKSATDNLNFVLNSNQKI